MSKSDKVRKLNEAIENTEYAKKYFYPYGLEEKEKMPNKITINNKKNTVRIISPNKSLVGDEKKILLQTNNRIKELVRQRERIIRKYQKENKTDEIPETEEINEIEDKIDMFQSKLNNIYSTIDRRNMKGGNRKTRKSSRNK